MAGRGQAVIQFMRTPFSWESPVSETDHKDTDSKAGTGSSRGALGRLGSAWVDVIGILKEEGARERICGRFAATDVMSTRGVPAQECTRVRAASFESVAQRMSAETSIAALPPLFDQPRKFPRCDHQSS